MTLKRDCRRDVPKWLERLTPAALKPSDFRLEQVLEHSLYYLAAGTDGLSVKFLGGFIRSFIYADHGWRESEVDKAIREQSFDGYRLAGSTCLNGRDLTPEGSFVDLRIAKFANGPLAKWYIFDRDHNRNEDHGPCRFSLVHLFADAGAVYQELYVQNHTAPEVLTIKGSGEFRGRDPYGFFASIVLQRSDQHISEYLICESAGPLDQPQACWPKAYLDHVEWFLRPKPYRRGVGVWRRRPEVRNDGEAES